MREVVTSQLAGRTLCLMKEEAPLERVLELEAWLSALCREGGVVCRKLQLQLIPITWKD
jgi:hypothetical protein